MRGTLALSLLLVCIGAPAAADVMGEDVYVCQDKELGDNCSVEQSSTPYLGTCQNGEYCHLIYGTCDSGGAPCGSACGPALVCKPGAAAEDDGGCAVSGRVATSAGSLLLGLALLGLCLRRTRR